MDFRRNGLRDERRRRVLIDETLHGADAVGASTTEAAEPAEVRTPAKAYSEAAIAGSQLPLTVFLPQRPIITWAVWLIGMVLIGAIELLYRFAYLNSPEELRESLTALDVNARGSLAGWFSALVLGVSAFASLLVYQIRRHRTDDYRGRYRWWLWLVPLLLVLSVNASTGFHQVLSGVLTSATGAEIAVQGKGWWLLAYAAVFFPIMLQLTIELWPSRLATFFFASTIAAYVTAALFEVDVLQLSTPIPTRLCHSSVLLAAHLGVLVTILAFGRYVYLDAHERLSPRRRWIRWPKRKHVNNRKKAKSSGKSAHSNTQVRVDEPHAKFGQENTTPPRVTLKADNSEQDDDDDSVVADDYDRKLSKAERRRLRKEAREARRED